AGAGDGLRRAVLAPAPLAGGRLGTVPARLGAGVLRGRTGEPDPVRRGERAVPEPVRGHTGAVRAAAARDAGVRSFPDGPARAGANRADAPAAAGCGLEPGYPATARRGRRHRRRQGLRAARPVLTGPRLGAPSSQRPVRRRTGDITKP